MKKLKMNKVHRTLSIHVYGHRSVIVLDRLRLKPFAVPWKSSILQKKKMLLMKINYFMLLQLSRKA